jgi:hypothetical protein
MTLPSSDVASVMTLSGPELVRTKNAQQAKPPCGSFHKFSGSVMKEQNFCHN